MSRFSQPLRAVWAGVLLAAVLSLAACEQSRPAGVVQEAAATRQADGAVALTWRADPAGAHVDIYQSADPRAPLNAMTRVAANIAGPTFAVAAPPGVRPYFALTPADGNSALRTAERILPLEAGRNFRDLGGYATSNGRHVKWGLLYRSGLMSRLTPADYSYLGRLGIKVICDLRTPREREQQPIARSTEIAPELATWDYDTGSSGIGPLIKAGPAATEAMARDTMKAIYTEMPAFFRTFYADIFRKLADGQVPLAFNCTAGKDRTGLLAALILSALEVPRETVIADYALTNTYVDYDAELRQEMAEDPVQPSRLTPFMTLAAPVRAAVLRADPDYIATSMRKIEADYGSVDGYLQKALGLSDQDLARLKQTLTE